MIRVAQARPSTSGAASGMGFPGSAFIRAQPRSIRLGRGASERPAGLGVGRIGGLGPPG